MVGLHHCITKGAFNNNYIQEMYNYTKTLGFGRIANAVKGQLLLSSIILPNDKRKDNFLKPD